MADSPALLLLAAGLGSRYGGPKQLQRVGPGGETLMDYSVFDAIRAGFQSIIFVTRPELLADVESVVASRYRHRLPVDLVLQRLDDLPAGHHPPADRRRPWGTGQAIWAARDVVTGPFAVLNADDFYGYAALTEMSRFLYDRGETDAGHWAVAGYPLSRTLSRAGGVNRALCQADEHDWLEHLVEIRDIVPDRRGGGIGTFHGAPMVLAGDDPVSMNLWGFTPSVIEKLGEGFATFLADHPVHEAEYLLPHAISALIRDRQARVRLLHTDSPWCGLSHSADRPAVEQFIRRLIADGVYPEQLPR
jgi:hypothetical protein